MQAAGGPVGEGGWSEDAAGDVHHREGHAAQRMHTLGGETIRLYIRFNRFSLFLPLFAPSVAWCHEGQLWLNSDQILYAHQSASITGSVAGACSDLIPLAGRDA